MKFSKLITKLLIGLSFASLILFGIVLRINRIYHNLSNKNELSPRQPPAPLSDSTHNRLLKMDGSQTQTYKPTYTHQLGICFLAGALTMLRESPELIKFIGNLSEPHDLAPYLHSIFAPSTEVNIEIDDFSRYIHDQFEWLATVR